MVESEAPAPRDHSLRSLGSKVIKRSVTTMQLVGPEGSFLLSPRIFSDCISMYVSEGVCRNLTLRPIKLCGDWRIKSTDQISTQISPVIHNWHVNYIVINLTLIHIKNPLFLWCCCKFLVSPSCRAHDVRLWIVGEFRKIHLHFRNLINRTMELGRTGSSIPLFYACDHQDPEDLWHFVDDHTLLHCDSYSRRNPTGWK